MIRQYVRKRNKKPVGILVAFKDDNGVHIGWSQCNKTDRFDKDTALQLAKQRALDPQTPGTVPHAVQKLLERFKTRASRYFKTAQNQG